MLKCKGNSFVWGGEADFLHSCPRFFAQSVLMSLDALIRSCPQPTWEMLLVLVTTAAGFLWPSLGHPQTSLLPHSIGKSKSPRPAARIHRMRGSLCLSIGTHTASLTYQPPPGFPNSTFETQTQKEWSEGCFLASFMSFLNTSSSSLPPNCTPTPSSWRECHYFCLPTLFSPFFYKQIPLSWGDTQILRSCQL